MLDRLKPLLSWRFIKFCAVGASGVVVNLGCLAVLTELAGLQPNLASAMAIEMSILTNFIINEQWTFRDRRSENRHPIERMLRFHLVSVGGAAIQWSVFVALNALFAFWLEPDVVRLGHGWFERYVLSSIVTPADVGALKYVSQLAGIGAATFWNYFANLYWTWRSDPQKGKEDA